MFISSCLRQLADTSFVSTKQLKLYPSILNSTWKLGLRSHEKSTACVNTEPWHQGCSAQWQLSVWQVDELDNRACLSLQACCMSAWARVHVLLVVGSRVYYVVLVAGWTTRLWVWLKPTHQWAEVFEANWSTLSCACCVLKPISMISWIKYAESSPLGCTWNHRNSQTIHCTWTM